MPHLRRYKCLNQECVGAASLSYTHIFVAFNDRAVCPSCESIKLEDWGESRSRKEGWERVQGAVTSHLKQSDANLRRVAERYGMTDMSNKDGKGVKVNQSAQQQTGPTVNVGGVPVPIPAAASGACINMPNMAKTLTGSWSGAKEGNMLKGMTNVVGRHDG